MTGIGDGRSGRTRRVRQTLLSVLYARGLIERKRDFNDPFYSDIVRSDGVPIGGSDSAPRPYGESVDLSVHGSGRGSYDLYVLCKDSFS